MIAISKRALNPTTTVTPHAAPNPPSPDKYDKGKSDIEDSFKSDVNLDPMDPNKLVWGAFKNDVIFSAREGTQLKAKLTGANNITRTFCQNPWGVVLYLLPMK